MRPCAGCGAAALASREIENGIAKIERPTRGQPTNTLT